MDNSRFLNINIGGQNRDLFFGNNTLEKIMEIEGVKYVTDVTKLPMHLTFIRSLIYAGLSVADRKAGRPVTYTIDDVSDWIDDMPEGNTKKLMDKFPLMVEGLGKMMGEIQPPATKKEKAQK